MRCTFDFVRRHDQGGPRGTNRFMLTSRIAGYRSAPLTGIGGKPFAHYMVQEMDDGQIKRFLERWCRAVEDAQTPDLAEETRQATAQREIDGILGEVQKTPGVRRLAANPLMLRVLALIHRTGARLPQKRVELYKLAADTLAHTWRPAQGVPTMALVEERYLTPLLGKLAYWIHLNKPTGIATEREVYEILGAEWARIRRLDLETQWEEIQGEVQKFLTAVREHTGLFVERAPKRYGFMHLTFEEYYAARHLVARRRDATKLIRRHLHDPRWEEPILLALGFVGLDYPEEAGELVETAILAQGVDAKELGIKPSLYEDILGRDYLFALRCLGDMIPVDQQIIESLIKRLVDELLLQQALGRFQKHRELLNNRLDSIVGTDAAVCLTRYALPALNNEDHGIRIRAANILGRIGEKSTEVVAILLQTIGDEGNNNWRLRREAETSLNKLLSFSPTLLDELLALVQDDDLRTQQNAISSLGCLEIVSTKVINILLAAIHSADLDTQGLIIQSLGRFKVTDPEVVYFLIDMLQNESSSIRAKAARSLGRGARIASHEALTSLVAASADNSSNVRKAIVQSIDDLGIVTPEAVQVLTTALDDQEEWVRVYAVQSLGHWVEDRPELASLLFSAAHHKDWHVRERAVWGLRWLKSVTPDLVIELGLALKDENPKVREMAAWSAGWLKVDEPELVHKLITALDDEDELVRVEAACRLVQINKVSSKVIQIISEGIKNPEREVHSTLLVRIAQLRRTSIEVIPNIEAMVVDATGNPDLSTSDKFDNRTGQDYAHEALWQFVVR